MLLSIIYMAACTSSSSQDTEEPGQEQSPEENNDNDGNQDSGGESDDPSGTGKDDDQDTGESDDANSGDKLDESEFDKAIDIVWNGAEVSIKNSSKLSVSNDGGHVTIGAPGAEGKKVRINLSGTSQDGSLKIYNGVKAEDTNKKMLICMQGVNLTSERGPAINIQSGKTVFILLKDGTQNFLKDAATYSGVPAEEDAKGCLFSEKQLVFSGQGTLNIAGQNKHAIAVDDYVHIQSGNITISQAKSDGIHTNDYLRIDGGVISVTSTEEAIQCEQAELGYFLMNDGEIMLNTSGEKCGGIETASDIIINGGKLTITASGAASKCLKSDNNITISGGILNLKTTGNGVYDSTTRDTSGAACIRAENNITLKGGEITCISTGNGGKGMNCYSFECQQGVNLNVSTSGGVYSYSSYKSRPKAIKATKLIKIDGGDITIKTTGTEGEGLESKASVEINGGKISINAKDDGINAAGVITFNGGYTYVYSTSNDGIDTNNGRANSIVVNGGVVISHAAGGAEEGFDADNHAYLTFNGGFVFCTGGQQGGGGGGGRPGWGGGSGSSSSPSCTQPSFMWSTAASIGYFTITDADGKVIMSCYVPRALSQNYSLVSAPLKAGERYKCGFTSTAPAGAETIFGTYVYLDGTQTGLNKTFTANSGYTTL